MRKYLGYIIWEYTDWEIEIEIIAVIANLQQEIAPYFSIRLFVITTLSFAR